MRHEARNARTVAIVGAGFSGTMAAVNLLRLDHAGIFNIILIERGARFGPGLAYGTWDDNLLLNVPAGNLSAFIEDPDHFLHFCQNLDPALDAGSFVPRRVYGEYLESLIENASRDRPRALRRIQDEAIGVSADGASGAVELASGSVVRADFIVLALGHGLPLDRGPSCWLFDTDRYARNPWSPDAYDGIQSRDAVLVIGTGHTATDVVFQLTGHSGVRKVFMVSRNGLVSHAHRPFAKLAVPEEFPEYLAHIPATALGYARAIRRHISESALDWRDVLRQLRPHTTTLWQGLSELQRQRFQRYLARYWDIHRHRLAPIAAARFDSLRKNGRVEVIAGSIERYVDDGDTVRVKVRIRQENTTREITIAKVINCTGPTYDIRCCGHPILRQLLDAGLLQRDALGLGLKVSRGYEILDAEGRASQIFHYIGPMLKAQYWEATAIPELRQHAQAMAQAFLEKTRAGMPANKVTLAKKAKTSTMNIADEGLDQSLSI